MHLDLGMYLMSNASRPASCHSTRPDVLFVCVHNSGRSVAAKLIFNDIALRQGVALRAESAGTEPGTYINPNVAKILKSMGLDTNQELPKVIEQSMLVNEPVIITMGCEVDADLCPAINMKDAHDWGLPDPAKLPSEAVAPIISQIESRVQKLISSLNS